MGETRQQREDRERRNRIAEQQGAARRAIGAELRRARLDANVSLRALGRASSLDPSHLARVEAGVAPSARTRSSQRRRRWVATCRSGCSSRRLHRTSATDSRC